MKLVNLMPHDFTFIDDNQIVHVVKSSGTVARCDEYPYLFDYICTDDFRLPIYKSGLGEITNLPEPQEDVIYIVSMQVAQAAKGRNDLIFPGTGPRDNSIRQDGKIVGVTCGKVW
jgi:hypothetical protein